MSAALSRPTFVTLRRPAVTAPAAAAAGSRVAWVDLAKGICIVLVVMMHSTLGVGEAMGGEGFLHAVVAFAKPFRMPDFFLVSGLFLSRVIDRDWRVYGDKRVVHFVYFYLLWLLIQSGFKYGQVSGGSPSGFVLHLLEGLVEPYSTLWFVYVLAMFSVATKLLWRWRLPVLLPLAALLQVADIHTGSYAVDEFCAYGIFFVVGAVAAPRIFAFAAACAARPAGAALGIAAWVAFNAAVALSPTGLPAHPHPFNLPVVGLASGIAGALAIVALAALLMRSGHAGWIRYCGRQSLAIYLGFFLPMAITRTVLIRAGVTDIGLVSTVVTLVAILVPLAVERGVRGTALGFLFTRPGWAHLGARTERGPRWQAAG